MTSSFMLSKLNQTGGAKTWGYSLPGSSLGGIEDSYIRLQGNCHPDFITHTIGKPGGVKLCVRKPLVGSNAVGCSLNERIGDPLHHKARDIKERSQGYNRASPRLYDVKSDFPVQEWNPQYYADRRMPWEQDLLARDYQRWPMTYSGTGIKTLRTPSQLRDEGKPYYQYGYSYTPNEDYDTGMRTATRPDQSVPPVKYDVTRLHQPYPVWKREQEHMEATLPNGQDVNTLDTTHYKRIV